MMAQTLLTFALACVIAYAGTQYRKSRLVALLATSAAVAGLYFVWFPFQATRLAQWAGIGRGVDLILYLWSVITLLMLLNLHLKLRSQLELITALNRSIAMSNPMGEWKSDSAPYQSGPAIQK